MRSGLRNIEEIKGSGERTLDLFDVSAATSHGCSPDLRSVNDLHVTFP